MAYQAPVKAPRELSFDGLKFVRDDAGTPVVGPQRWGGVGGECATLPRWRGAGWSTACRPTAVPPWSARHEPWPTAAPPRDAAMDEASRQRTVPLSRSILRILESYIIGKSYWFTVPNRQTYLNFVATVQIKIVSDPNAHSASFVGR